MGIAILILYAYVAGLTSEWLSWKFDTLGKQTDFATTKCILWGALWPALWIGFLMEYRWLTPREISAKN